MSEKILRPYRNSKSTFECESVVLGEQMNKLHHFLRELCPGPRDAMALLHAMREYYMDQYGVKEITTTGENRPQ